MLATCFWTSQLPLFPVDHEPCAGWYPLQLKYGGMWWWCSLRTTTVSNSVTRSICHPPSVTVTGKQECWACHHPAEEVMLLHTLGCLLSSQGRSSSGLQLRPQTVFFLNQHFFFFVTTYCLSQTHPKGSKYWNNRRLFWMRMKGKQSLSQPDARAQNRPTTTRASVL